MGVGLAIKDMLFYIFFCQRKLRLANQLIFFLSMIFFVLIFKEGNILLFVLENFRFYVRSFFDIFGYVLVVKKMRKIKFRKKKVNHILFKNHVVYCNSQQFIATESR